MVNIMDTLVKETILETLHETICKVTFTKTNGEERIMYCTLNESMMPKLEDTSETKRTKKENPEVQPVYDVKAAGWRSFRWDSVKEFTSELNV
jgi:hypothetical protein